MGHDVCCDYMFEKIIIKGKEIKGNVQHVSYVLASHNSIIYVQAHRLSKVCFVSGSETIRVLLITEIVCANCVLDQLC